MGAPSLQRVAWTAAATLVGGAAVLLWQEDKSDSLSPTIVTHPAFSSGRPTEAMASVSQATTKNNGPEKNGLSTPNHGSAAQPSLNTPDTKLSRYLFTRFLRAKTSREKMDNLRWCLELYGNTINPENIAKASLSLGIEKKDLIEMIRKTALAVFKEASSPPTSSRYEQVNFWNDLNHALKYVGIDTDGNNDPALAESRTGYSRERIISIRDSFTVAATYEISPQTNRIVEGMTSTAEGYIKGRMARRDSIEKAVLSLSLHEQISLRDKIYLINYTVNHMDGQDTEENLALLGINPYVFRNLDLIEKVITYQVDKAFEKESESYTDPIKKPEPYLSDGVWKFSDLPIVLNGYLLK